MSEYRFKFTEKYVKARHNSIYYRDFDKELTNIEHATIDKGNTYNLYKINRYLVCIGVKKDGDLYFNDYRNNIKGVKKVNSNDVEQLISEYTIWLSQMIQHGYLIVEELKENK